MTKHYVLTAIVAAGVILVGSGCDLASRPEVISPETAASPSVSGEASDAMNSEDQPVDQLVGRWQATDDSNVIVEFTATERTEYYAGQLMSTDPYDLNKERLVVTSADGLYEYSVVMVGADNLELQYLPRGNTLRYQRVVAE